MNDDNGDEAVKNVELKGFWWKRFFYSSTGGSRDFAMGPNWFASVMGTGIIANAAASLPLFSDQLHVFSVVVWILASTMLVGLLLATLNPLVQHQGVWKQHFNDPTMVQFYGAPPMAMLTIAGGTVLVGAPYLGQALAVNIAWVLWFIGTLLGLATAVIIPFRLFTHFEVSPDSAFGGWLMPVVPPMVSAAIGAILVPYAPVGVLRETLFYVCFSLFGLSLIAAFIIIVMIWSRLAHHGTSGSSRVPTLWIVLGPLGQSMTAAGILGTVAIGAVPEAIAKGFEVFSVLYSIPVFGFIVLWTCLAMLLTLRARRRHMRFALTYWSFTFPVGTCVTGMAQLAHHTGSPLFQWASVLYYVALLLAWCLAAFGTTRGIMQGHILRHPVPSSVPVKPMKG
ncbi:TDT family transporter [Kistimonas asteriae]|uniref:TDT family transporter n=1 Tax=Kistimonas asteriae TaxID=517724 RepID=UPI001BACC268|nr:TDT family transporter [Kistimonas asteriae]